MFTENKITEFENKIQKLADRPQMSAQALKAYFDGSAEELRIAHNALIDALSAFAPHTFSDVHYNGADGKLTFVLTDGSKKEIDLPLELLIQSGHYDAQTQNIVLVLANGDTLTVPVGDLVDTYHADGSTIVCENNTFAVKDGVFAPAKQTATDIANAREAAIAEAKVYTDALEEKTAADLSKAKADAIAESKGYADALENKTKTDITTAKETAVSDAKTYTDTKVGNEAYQVEQTAINYTDSMVTYAIEEAKAYADAAISGISAGALPEITIEEADRLTDGIYRIIDEYHDAEWPEGERYNGILIASYDFQDSGREDDFSLLMQVWIQHDGSIVYRTNYSSDTFSYESDGRVWVDYDANAWEGWTAWKDVVQTKIENNRKLKLLKTITLEEDVTDVNVTFDRPLDELAVVFKGAFRDAVNAGLSGRTDGGVWYMFNRQFAAKTTTSYYFAHAKEIGERLWESYFFDGSVGDVTGASSLATRMTVSTRIANLSRFVKDFNIFVTNRATSLAAGSIIEVWGHEADE